MAQRAEEKAQRRAEREAAERAEAEAAARRRRLGIIGAAFGVAIVLVVALVVISSGGSKKKALAPAAAPVLPASATAAATSTGPIGQQPAGLASERALLVGIPQQGLALGAATAPVTLIEYADLKCPICREYTLAGFQQLVANYVRPGQLRIVFVPQTFVGQPPGDSERAARFGIAAGRQNRFWNYEDLFYENQQDENTGYATDAYLRYLGSWVEGLNVTKALAQRSEPQVALELQRASNQFTAAGFTGTPSFQIGRSGGVMQTLNVQSFDVSAFAPAIQALLKK